MDASCMNLFNHLNYQFNQFRNFYIGAVVHSARTADFGGWLLCDGRAISRSQYARLFDVIGTQFGVGDGLTTFNLPDPASRLLGVAGAGSGLTTRAIGDITGQETTTLAVTNLPDHVHTGTTDADGAHTHAITDPGHSHATTSNTTVQKTGNNTPSGLDSTANEIDNVSTLTLSVNSATTGISINSNGTHTHTFSSSNTVGANATPFTNMPPTLFVGNLFIYCGNCVN
jgi:microcystin-dependent protein